MLRKAIRFTPFLAVALIIVSVVAVVSHAALSPKSVTVESEPVTLVPSYTPLVLPTSITIRETDVLPGNRITATNGVCNSSDTVLYVTYNARLVVEPPSPTSQPFTLLEGGLYLEAGQCEGNALVLRLPSITEPGVYKLALEVSTVGTQSMQRQSSIVLSSPFRVVDVEVQP